MTKYDYLIGKVYEYRRGNLRKKYFQIEYVFEDPYPRFYYKFLGDGSYGSMPITTLLAPVNSKIYKEVKHEQ
jgi:hypothetical protein